MNRYEPFYPYYDRDDCDCRNKKKSAPCGCLPAAKHEGHPWKDDAPFRMRLFDNCRRYCDEQPPVYSSPPVTIVNPWNCREKVQVLLSVDECGNLVVCIRR